MTRAEVKAMRGAFDYDAAIVGAGPSGCASALALARTGRRVLLLEADPRHADRLAGEWLHPPAVDVLDSLGVDLAPTAPYATGRGFVVFPEDGSDPIVLPYAAERFGLAVEHALLVETLRAHCERDPDVELVPWARATRIEGQTLTYERKHGATRTVRAPLLVGASGRAVSGPLGDGRGPFAAAPAASSRVAGIAIECARLPFEGYLHVFLGAAGPVMAYRIDARRARVLCDVPQSSPLPREGGVALFEAYASVLPGELRASFRDALRERAPAWASVELRPRGDLGREGLALVGDAAGTHPPLVAMGLTLALEDARALAEAPTFDAYRRERTRRARVREMLCVGLYEVFADDAEESLSLRRAVYELWRARPSERLRTMGFLSGDDRSAPAFARAFSGTLLRGSRDLARSAWRARDPRHAGRVAAHLGQRIAWLLGGTLHLTDALPPAHPRALDPSRAAEARYGAALRASAAKAGVAVLPRDAQDFSAAESLRAATGALLREQAADGSFEGEVVWCPMLAAQYVLAWHAMGRSLSPERRAHLLLHFERTRLDSGSWGLHEKSEPYLFVTLLVYVACRLLGLAKDDPLLARAHAFVRREGGAMAIPTWGKLWLAIVGLYSWEGVSAVLPEAWRAPRWLPFHPSRFYCHTRLIYLGMAVLFGEKWQSPVTPRVLAIRDEIWLEEWESIDWARARETLRSAEIHTPWTPALTGGYRLLASLDRARPRAARDAVLAELREQIRYELRSTNHTCISPVSGLLDQIALFIDDPRDPDLALAAERFEGWVWDDEVDGARITGARSATWDTSFAAQALAAAAPHCGGELSDAQRRADAFLETQQIARGSGREAAHDRIDPTGGYCFAGVWHGWPVSDCTAEAMLARLESKVASPSREAMESAARFVLRCRNSDGGFGSYEARRTELSLEWMNPAEMFGDSMTEKSYVECTASCVAALAAFVHRYPDSGLVAECRAAILGGVECLTAAQRADGSWAGMWGVHFVYGTMFGVRGLLAGGVPPHDPRVRRACRFLEERQRPDGAWGEHHASVTADRWVDHEDGQVVSTAWALTTLLEAQHPDFAPIERAARWLEARQAPDGTWAKQDPEGIFFHTALLEYALYRRYFPVWALGLYESRRAERASFRAARTAERRPISHPLRGER